MRNIKNLRKKMELERVCLKNARNLLEEANKMLNEKKYAFATFLAITSYEETQKLRLLSMYKEGYISEKDFCKYWASHITKHSVSNARIRVLIDDNDRVITEPIFGSEKEAQKVINIRNSCLYVDFSENTIKSPKDVTVGMAVDYINVANKELETAVVFKKLAREIRKRLGKN